VDLMRKRPRNAVAIFLSTVAAISAHASSMYEPPAGQPASVAIDSRPAGPVRPIGIIDFYGSHRLTTEQLRNELTFKVGDSVTLGDLSFFGPSEQRLMKVPGVSRARVQVVCCNNDRSVVFVGIEEGNAPALQFRPAPTGSVRLPSDVLQVGADFEQLWDKEVTSGQAEEDDSEGHMLFLDAAARPTEDRLIAVAKIDLPLIRKVLHDSANPEHRALAAQLLGYAKNMQSVVPDLVYAMSDPAESVRNNAMRALAVFKSATKVKPPQVPYGPFIALLNSPIWTDRNKSSIALMQMASTRDAVLLTMLRSQALPSLVEMARWNDREHAYFAFRILGYLSGLSDGDIDASEGNNRELVIERALSLP